MITSMHGARNSHAAAQSRPSARRKLSLAPVVLLSRPSRPHKCALRSDCHYTKAPPTVFAKKQPRSIPLQPHGPSRGSPLKVSVIGSRASGHALGSTTRRSASGLGRPSQPTCSM